MAGLFYSSIFGELTKQVQVVLTRRQSYVRDFSTKISMKDI